MPYDETILSQHDMVQCGAVRCCAVRCGAVRCGAVRCGAVLGIIFRILRSVTVVTVRCTFVKVHSNGTAQSGAVRKTSSIRKTNPHRQTPLMKYCNSVD